MNVRRFLYLAGSLLLLLAIWFVQEIPARSLPAPHAALAAASAGQQGSFSIRASLPMTLPTGTPPPTDPEYLILQYVRDTHPSWNCGAITGTPRHRTLNECHPFGYFSHPTDGHMDGYGSPYEAYNQWAALRAAAQGYPHFIDMYYRASTGYEAGDDNFPYAHYESYYYAQSWVMGGVSSDDTIYRGAPPMAFAIIDAAWDLGYFGAGSVTPTPTVTGTPPPTDPEYLILQYVRNNHPAWGCAPVGGSEGHRVLPTCDLGYYQHYTNGYIDNYGSPSAAQAAWEVRRTNAQQQYPNFQDTSYQSYPGYEAWNNNVPSTDESYYWASVWNMGAVSSDYTNNFRGAPSMARAIIDAALALGYLGPSSPTPTPTQFVACDVFYPSLTSACATPPSTYGYGFSAYVVCNQSLTATGSIRFEVSSSPSGPWTLWDTQPFNSTFPPGWSTVNGTLAESGIPSQYAYYHTLIGVMFSNNQFVSATSPASTLCGLNGTVTVTISVTPTPTSTPTVCVPAGWGYGSSYSEPIMEEAMAPRGGFLYATGGRSGGATVADTFVYDTITRNWSTLAPQPQARHGSSAVNVGSLIYVLNGANSSGNATNTVYRFDPVSNDWTVTGNSLVSTWGQAAVLLNNDIYRIAGCVSQDCTGTTDTVERGGQLVANYPMSVGWPMAVALDGYIYVAGGTVGIGGPGTAKTYRYDPSTDTWDDSAITDLPDLRWGAASGVVNGKWVLAGGYSYTSVLNTAMEWDPATNTWSSLPNMPAGRGQPGSAVDNGILYVAGGNPARGAFQGSVDVQLYNPGSCGTPGATSTITGTATPPGLTQTSTPTPTGTPTVLCDVFEPSITSACQVTPSTYSYDFSALVYCPYGIHAEGTLEFDVAPSDSGPWTEWDQQSISGTLYANIGHIYGTLTESGIPSQYNRYRLVANMHTSNGQVLTATSAPAVLCNGPTPTATSATGTPTATVTACPIRFSDVPQGSTFYPYIRCLACKGLVSGYPDGSFKPNANVTRGQLSKIVSNAAGFTDPQTLQMFEDVPVGSTFFAFIGRLASRGYIGGYPCGGVGEPCNPPGNLPYFRPNNNATRGQISKIDANAAGLSDPPSGQQFEDVPVGSTYYTYTYRLVSRSIMAGYQCGGAGEPCIPPDNLPYFRPNNNATRGQTSKIVANTFFPNCQTPARK